MEIRELARALYAFHSLDQREQYVLLKRFQLQIPSEHAASLRELAAALGITYQRVQQIEERALEKLSNATKETDDAAVINEHLLPVLPELPEGMRRRGEAFGVREVAAPPQSSGGQGD